MTPMPIGMPIMLDPDARELAPGVWYGGSPPRVIRLSTAGRAVWRRVLSGGVDSPAAAVLARRFTDAGLAHPCPSPAAPRTVDVTVVIPVRDRAPLLDRCLAGMAGSYPVVVVDDDSHDPAAVATVAAVHGATVVRRAVNGGPAAARNTGLDHVTTELVAFVDSDTAPPPGWIERLAGHFSDPMVAAVAPRITSLAGPSVVGRYTRVAGSLDLGDRPARMVPTTRLAYVPTAAIVARRAALSAAAGPSGAFDSSMRVGEDVDLVWRLHLGGWRIRYDPAVQVGHHEPATWPALLARRLYYGTSAAPLAQRHPTFIPPLVMDPWPAMTVAALLARRPLVAAAAFALSGLTTRRSLRAHDLPADDAWRTNTAAIGQTFVGVGRYLTQYAPPAIVAMLLSGGRGRWGRRAAAASLLLGPPLMAWARRRPEIDPIRFAAAAVAEDVAYGVGVWAGCVAHRTIAPLRPVVRWRRGKRGAS